MLKVAIGILVTLVVVCVGFSPARAAEETELEVDHALTLEVTTPHTDWARPYAQGKTSVLFFTDAEDLRPRECVELMQRFDLEAEAVFWSKIVDSANSHWHGGEQGEARMLRKLDRKWDCFVFLEMGMSNMSEEQQYKLLRQVADGAGLVFVGTDDRRVLKESNRLPEVPAFLQVENLQAAYTVGKGRGVRLTQRPFLKYAFGWETEYDHWQERLGRAVLWAARKDPRFSLELTPYQQPGKRNCLRVRLTGTASGKGLSLDATVKREGEVRASIRHQSISVEGPLELALPYFPEGSYHVDARVVGGSGVETWGTTEFRVQSSRSVARVDFDRDWGEVGDFCKGLVELSGGKLRNEKLQVRLLDRHRRELQRREIASFDSRVPFQFHLKSWMPMLLTVDAVLFSDGKEMSHAWSYFRVTKRNRGRFNLMMWSCPSGTLAPYAEEELAKTGVTLQLQGGEAPIVASAFNIALVPYTTRITPFKEIIPDESMKPWGFPFCWNDENAVEAHAASLVRSYQKAREQGVFAWSLGDETTTQGACLSEHCQTAYRRYLREVYGSLDGLNESWSTRFTSWDEVGVLPAEPGTDDATYRLYFKSVTTDHNLAYLWFTDPAIPIDKMKFNKAFYETEEGVAWQQKNYARWYDRQAFKSWNFVELCKRYDRAFKSLDPQARTGFEGAGRFRYGDDADLLVRNTGFWGPYPDTMDEVVRSIAPRDYPRFNWMGYQKDADSLLGVYWRMVTRGMDTVAWWTWYVLGQFHGWLAPDLRPFPAVKEILKDTQIMRDGLGDLLLRCEMQDDGIAVLYSPPSFYAHKLENGKTFCDYEEDHKATHEMLRNLGLQFRYVTDRMLRLGEFDQRRFKVLILPCSDAIGDKEAAVIEEFARRGGTVIADVRPGVFNDRCKLRNKGALDDLFGIRRRGLGSAKSEKVSIRNPDLAFDHAAVDADVELAGATARGSAEGIPAVIVREVGKGRAILLNFTFASFPRLTSDATPNAAEFVSRILSRAGVDSQVTLKDETGNPLRSVEVTRWKNGDMDILSLFRIDGKNEPAQVVLPRDSFVYDLRGRTSLGKTRTIKTAILAHRASFFVLSPRPAPSPIITLAKADVTRGSVITAQIHVPGAKGLHAFCLRVTANGQPQAWHDQIVVAGGRPVLADLPIAFNDPVGTWEIAAVDLFTNRTSALSIKVK